MRSKLFDHAYLAQLWLRTLRRERRRWRKPVRAGEAVRVFFGFDRLPERHEKAFGGIVKIQDLREHFSNHAEGANILYLVSSYFPDFAVRMARMAKNAGVKIVLNQNGVAYPGWCGRKWKAINRPRRRLLQMADYVFYQSRFCKEAADRFLCTREQDSEILYNPVDTDFFKPAGSSAVIEGVRLLLAGSHQSSYRVEVVLEAFKRVLSKIPDTRLIIVGRYCWHRDEKHARQEVRSLIGRMGLDNRVELKGAYTQLQAPSIFQAGHILIHSKYNDPCPRLVVEAMACGLPVVYSATGGVPELAGEEAGIGVRGPVDWEKDHPPDPKAIAGAIFQVLSSRERYSRAARERAVRLFDLRPWLERHEAVFKALVNR